MNTLTAPHVIDDVLTMLQELIRRSIDGTIVPLVVDYTNNRVLIGTTTASTSNNGSLEVDGGDIKINTAGKGLIISNRAGTAYYRLIMDNDGAIAADPL